MPSLEDRLFYRLEANLNHRDEVIEKYRHKIDVMRDYSFKNDISVQMAAALNIYRRRYRLKGNGITTSDIGIYNLMHGSDNINSYECMHGIKTFIFHIAIERENNKIILQKMGMPDFFGGVAFPAQFFHGFKSYALFFSTFGLVITGRSSASYRDFQHEALHIDKRIYSRHFASLVTFELNPNYTAGLWRAKLQANLIDEILSFLCSGMDKDNLAESLCSHYWQYYFDSAFRNSFSELNGEEKVAKQKELELILVPSKADIGRTLSSAYELKSQLPFDVLVPIFFALGPNSKEIKNGCLYSPFLDIQHWAFLLETRHATPEKIKQQLQKKGYCKDSAIFSYLKR